MSSYGFRWHGICIQYSSIPRQWLIRILTIYNISIRVIANRWPGRVRTIYNYTSHNIRVSSRQTRTCLCYYKFIYCYYKLYISGKDVVSNKGSGKQISEEINSTTREQNIWQVFTIFLKLINKFTGNRMYQ